MKAIVIAGALLLTACAPGTTVPPQVITSGIDLAICVINVSSADIAAGKPAEQVILDCVSQCGADAASVVKILDAEHAAQAREKAAGK